MRMLLVKMLFSPIRPLRTRRRRPLLSGDVSPILAAGAAFGFLAQNRRGSRWLPEMCYNMRVLYTKIYYDQTGCLSVAQFRAGETGRSFGLQKKQNFLIL